MKTNVFTRGSGKLEHQSEMQQKADGRSEEAAENYGSVKRICWQENYSSFTPQIIFFMDGCQEESHHWKEVMRSPACSLSVGERSETLIKLLWSSERKAEPFTLHTGNSAAESGHYIAPWTHYPHGEGDASIMPFGWFSSKQMRKEIRFVGRMMETK